jgi:heme-degrading monooxygenase HmoA
MSELAISTGTWIVDSTKQQAFVDAWTEFVKWAATMPGATTFRLGHASQDERRFVSFAAWTTPEEAAAWKNSPEFQEHIAHVLQHVDDFQSVQLDVVATVNREPEYGRA